MAEDGNGEYENQASTSVQKWRTSKEANHAWASLKRRKGNPEAAALKRWSVSEASSSKSRRTYATIAESAAKELESLAVHMPNASGTYQKLVTHICLIGHQWETFRWTPLCSTFIVQTLLHHYRTHLACVQRGTPIPWLHSLRF